MFVSRPASSSREIPTVYGGCVQAHKKIHRDTTTVRVVAGHFPTEMNR